MGVNWFCNVLTQPALVCLRERSAMPPKLQLQANSRYQALFEWACEAMTKSPNLKSPNLKLLTNQKIVPACLSVHFLLVCTCYWYPLVPCRCLGSNWKPAPGQAGVGASAHTHTCTHARTHTHTHARAHTRTRMHARTHTHAHAHTHTHTHTQGLCWPTRAIFERPEMFLLKYGRPQRTCRMCG